LKYRDQQRRETGFFMIRTGSCFSLKCTSRVLQKYEADYQRIFSGGDAFIPGSLADVTYAYNKGFLRMDGKIPLNYV
jgi:hypothetical protein